ncbi:hypothetical protein I79_004232 [Cricetulus griseus]|uniref:Uncharacterized protein n=1 Tax=Cricetulus griseus TaxID=10029 RepID=G3H230_CRIGR|nr:hypothetical protein I79_004232 [Cricetulus griseus]
MPGRRCRLLSLWEMVGDIAETTQSPVCGSLRLAFWISLVPGPRVWTRVSKTHRQEGGRGETSRCFAAQSQIPGRWPRRSLSRCPEKRLQGACRSSPGSHAGIKAEGWPGGRGRPAPPPACLQLPGGLCCHCSRHSPRPTPEIQDDFLPRASGSGALSK